MSKFKEKIKAKLVPKVIPIYDLIGLDKLHTNNIALITGGDGEIGYSIAKKTIECGGKVVITGRNEEKLKKCVKMLGECSSYVVLDISKTETISTQLEKATKIFGKLDILVNCAGIHISRDDLSFLNISECEYDNVMNVNLKGAFFVTQYISNYFINNKINGHILFVSSNRGNEPAWSPYGISKWGLNGLCKGLAKSLIKHNIIVNEISPGPTATKMNDFKDGDSIYSNQNLINRYTMPEEIAVYAVLLTSHLGDTIVGDTIYLSGGRGTVDFR